jgi:hypothetical protein
MAGLTPDTMIIPTVQTMVDRTAGTAIGDMVNNGGLAAAFDGTEAQGTAACCGKQNVATNGKGGVGKDWGAGTAKLVSGFWCKGASDGGYAWADSNTATITITLKGSNVGFSLGGGDTLGSVSGTDANSLELSKLTGITGGYYRYHWVEISHNHASTQGIGTAEVKFYEEV